MAMASDSSLDPTDLDGQSSCPHCNARMSSLNYDRHKCCVTCRGKDCTLDLKCVECSLWPSDVFNKYVKHRRSLISKSRSKKSRKDSSGAVPCKSPVVGRGDQGTVNDPIPSSGISEDRVKSLISDSFASLSQSFAASMRESFAKIDDLISHCISEANISQDVSNPSFSGSPHVPIHLSLGRERPDPSQSSSQQDYGKSEGEPEESVRGESAVSPDLMSWVSDLRTAGVCIPDQVAALVRPVRDDSRVSAFNAQPSGSQGTNAQVESELGASTSDVRGLFPPSSSFSFGEVKSASSVSFVLPPLGTDRDEYENSETPAIPTQSEGSSRVSRLIAQLCPEAIPASVASSVRLSI